MKTRIFPKAKINATELALGAWAIGSKQYGKVSAQKAQNTIESYIDAGGNFIDTARAYDLSEERIGQALCSSALRENLVIATKTQKGGSLESIPQIRDELEQSLKALRTDYIDIYQLHSPSEDPKVIQASLEELERFKAEGKIRATGASIKGPNVTQETVDLCKTYIDAGIEVIQLVYSVARQKTSEVFEYAQSKGVGLIARTVLESGFLTGNYDLNATFPTGDHRQRWSAEQIQAMADIASDIKANHLPEGYHAPSEVAIKFALAEPAITTLILGAKTPAQVQRNMSTNALPELPRQTIQKLRASYRSKNNAFNLA